MTLDQFEIQYKNYLSNEVTALKQIQENRKAEQRIDEAKFAQIELNVVDIFEKMFTVSLQKSKTAPDWKLALNEAYLHFFTKIPTPWAERLKQCEAHQLDDEAHIERIKLERAEKLKTDFEQLLSQA